jgi:peptide/nickel transport system substrate-binding protein
MNGRLARLSAISTFSVAFVSAAFVAATFAHDLTIGMAGSVTSIDPHFFVAVPNNTISSHLFDRLVTRTAADAKLAPALATSWKLTADTVWEFKLRPGVKWHDGRDFAADDVVFTFARVPNVPNSPASFAPFLTGIQSLEVVDPLTIRVHTASPSPNLPTNLAFLSIISRHAGEGATTADYNSGKVTIGTGAYKFVSSAPDHITMARNDDWWGPKTDWEHVTFRIMPNSTARVAALLSGDVDLIDSPPPADLARLKADERISVVVTQSLFHMNLSLDFSHQGESPFVTDNGGNLLPHNPLLDVRVRRALSMAIDRAALADRLMQGAAVPAGQWLPPGAYSYAASVAPARYDPEKAKQGLTDAGYPQGFHVTVHGPNDRYQGDTAIAQAIAQMWTRVGVQTSVEAMPWSVYSSRASHGDFAVGLRGWNSPTAEAGNTLFVLLGTQNAATGRGVQNWARYSSAALDKVTEDALATLDDGAREKLMIRATEMAMSDVAFIPLFYVKNMWAMQKKVTYEGRMDAYTRAMDVHLAH